MNGNGKPRFDDNDHEGFDLHEINAKNMERKKTQPATSDDIVKNKRSAFDEEHMGDGVGIGNENYEEDGGAELGFGQSDETEDKDRENPLRRAPGGGATSDGLNEGY
jgi:hypothetical protein